MHPLHFVGVLFVIRAVLMLFSLFACLASVPVGPSTPKPLTQPSTSAGETAPSTISKSEFAELAKTDVLAMLKSSLHRYQAEVRGYRCLLHKQERVNGTLGKVELIQVALRDDPFAVHLRWKEGAGLATATLYSEGENRGQLKVQTFLGLQDSDPNGILARQSARYSILDFGIYRGTLRTYQTWKNAEKTGRLQVEYLGTKPIPECNNRVCHVIRRTCVPWEVDNFLISDQVRKSPELYPKDAIQFASIMIDAETFLHIGSDLRHPDGTLIAAYYFRDLELNPIFDRNQFRLSSLTK
jgi:Protein of unknown function (DUF1571)